MHRATSMFSVYPSRVDNRIAGPMAIASILTKAGITLPTPTDGLAACLRLVKLSLWLWRNSTVPLMTVISFGFAQTMTVVWIRTIGIAAIQMEWKSHQMIDWSFASKQRLLVAQDSRFVPRLFRNRKHHLPSGYGSTNATTTTKRMWNSLWINTLTQ